MSDEGKPTLAHSHLNARFGSNDAARRAGTTQATKAMVRRKAGTATNVIASVELTPYSRLAAVRLSTTARLRPIADPRAVKVIPCFSTIPRT